MRRIGEHREELAIPRPAADILGGQEFSPAVQTVEELQSPLQAKAKSEPRYRSIAWDKVCREDVLLEVYRRSRANAGAPGVDAVDFAAIEATGTES
jgi:hypothetical protein